MILHHLNLFWGKWTAVTSLGKIRSSLFRMSSCSFLKYPPADRVGMKPLTISSDPTLAQIRVPSIAYAGSATVLLSIVLSKFGRQNLDRILDDILQGGPKKTAPNFSCNNFGKYGPILIMFSLLHSQMNWRKARLKSNTSPQICCCTTLWKLNVQLYSYLWTKTATFRRSWFTSRMYH